MLRTVAFNPSSAARVAVRAPNWLGDAVISLPALRAIRGIFPGAHLAVIARPALAGLYAREGVVDGVIRYVQGERWSTAARLRAERFDAAILLQNAFDAALLAWLGRIPERIGYNRDGRRFLLTHPVPVPTRGEIPRHERFYYLELLRRAGWVEALPPCDSIQLDALDQARAAGRSRLEALGISGAAIGISPGAAYGGAKRYGRFAEAARALAALGAEFTALVFGSASEAPLCEEVAASIPNARNLAGSTSLTEFIELAAACRLFLTNDSGSMHVAYAAGVPTVAVFGPTDEAGTGPSSPLARVVREPVECAPCLLRECPIDHRCMNRVRPERVAEVAWQLWRAEPRSGAAPNNAS